MSDVVNHPPISKEDFYKYVDIDIESGCWIWNKSKCEKRGRYGQLMTCTNGKPKLYKAHRVAWWAFNGFDPGKKLVCHKCDNPPCCNPDHLFLGTYADNWHDCKKRDRAYVFPVVHGEESPSAKLGESDVRAIRGLIELREITQTEIARRYGVTKALITRIKYKRAWGWMI